MALGNVTFIGSNHGESAIPGNVADDIRTECDDGQERCPRAETHFANAKGASAFLPDLRSYGGPRGLWRKRQQFRGLPLCSAVAESDPDAGYWPFALYHRRRRHRVRRIADSIANLTGKAGV